MDSDLEEQRYRYTVGQFMMLNNGRVKLSADLKSIFSTYVMPECSKELTYNNKHNIKFNVPGVVAEPKRKQISLRRRDDAYSDSNILSELRHAFSSVVKGTGGTIHTIAKLSQILIPPTVVSEVAQLFFSTIIQSPKQMPEYLKVLFSFSQPNQLERRVQLEFVKLAMTTFKDPPILKTSPLESGEDRTRRHRMTSCQLIASLFMYEFDPSNIPAHIKPAETFGNIDKLRQKVIEPLLDDARQNVEAIKNLAVVWGILLPKYKHVLDEYLGELRSIYTNADFKLTSRIALKDYCE